jgi:hypothetical protein
MTGWEKTQLSLKLQSLLPSAAHPIRRPVQLVLSSRLSDELFHFGAMNNLSPAACFFFMVSFAWGIGRRQGWDTRRMLTQATKTWAEEHTADEPRELFVFMLDFVRKQGKTLGWDAGGMLGYAVKAWEACERNLKRQTGGEPVSTGSVIVKP